MSEVGRVRQEAVVIGPSRPGFLIVKLGTREAEVPQDLVPPGLRVPNSHFIAVMRSGSMIGVDPEGAMQKQIQDRIRSVFNEAWDPIGVSDTVSDEYDAYVGRICSMLVHRTTDAEIAERLLRIEVDDMGLRGSALSCRMQVVRRLRGLDPINPDE